MNQQKFLILITIISALACVAFIVAFCTDHWLEANAVLTDRLRSNVSYGLFGGFIERHQLASTLKFSLTVVCHVDFNACMYSCQSDSKQRQDELRRVIRGQELQPCNQRRLAKAKQEHLRFPNTSTHAVISSSIMAFKETTTNHSNSTANKETYFSASLYISAVLFLCLSCAFSLMSGLCSAINLKWHPVERIFNIFGLFAWNGISAFCCFSSLALWSAMFSSQLRYNIAITDTLRQQLKFSSQGYASLGYSYYLVLVIMLLHTINLILLFGRNHCIGKEPPQVPNNVGIDATDASLQFY